MDTDKFEKYLCPSSLQKLYFVINVATRQDWLDPLKDDLKLSSEELVLIYAHYLNSDVPLPESLKEKANAGSLVDKIIAGFA